MNAFNKIGLHVSGDYDSDVLRDYLRSLGSAGIPFFVVFDTSGDSLALAQRLAAENPGAGHTVVYRNSTALPEPDFTLPPEAAADAFWALQMAALPDSVDRETWLEPMSLMNVDRRDANWLGLFATQLGRLALADGRRLAAFSFAVNQPAADFWQRAGVLEYLTLCAQNPGRLGVALCEFSREVDDIWYRRDDHIGRFYNLFALCDRAALSRPPVLITEWGWTPDKMPPRRRALADIADVAAFYARYPDILGAAIYRIGPDDAPIARRGRRLVRPLTAWTLETVLDVAIDYPPLPPGLEAITEGLGTPNARFISDITIPDDTRLPPGQAFTKTWRVQNSGGVDWTDRYRLVHVGGPTMTVKTSWPVPALRIGETGDVSIPMTAPEVPGVAFSDWRFQDESGAVFGDVVYARILVAGALEPAGLLNDAKFVTDVTVPDDVEIPPGTAFTKTWRVRNTGASTWGPGYSLNFAGGASLAAAPSFPLPAAAPGTEVDVSVPMVAPMTAGVYYADYRLKDAEGKPFGDLVYVRFRVPRPPGPTLAAPQSQQDPRWAARRLGQVGSPKTIGDWGCLVAVLAMTANALGKDTDPSRLNDRLLEVDGFLDLYLTKWGALSLAYDDIVFDGRVEAAPDLLTFINASLEQGIPVPVQVDFTSDTPYTENDQHWVLIVGRDGADYRINDPWLFPPQEASLLERYGRAGKTAGESVLSALFHRQVGPGYAPPQELGRPKPEVHRLERGMNINPDAPNSNPLDSQELKGLDWVRFVFKLAARVKAAERDDQSAAFAQYDPLVEGYTSLGVRCLIILNQETVWGSAPWTGSDDWERYARELAVVAGTIADHYRRYGDQIAYQIWNEGDKKHNPASVYVPPTDFAEVLGATAAAVRAASPQSPIIFNGMATGPEESVAYLKAVQAALGRPLPVDAVGVHPYTRWATRAPFDWGSRYGTLSDAFAVYRKAFPKMKLWITEIGVADDNEIGPEHYPAIADYMRDIYSHVAARHVEQVPVVIWFAWSDWMRNAGVVRRDGAEKDHLYAAFRSVRNREV